MKQNNFFALHCIAYCMYHAALRQIDGVWNFLSCTIKWIFEGNFVFGCSSSIEINPMELLQYVQLYISYRCYLSENIPRVFVTLLEISFIPFLLPSSLSPVSPLPPMKIFSLCLRRLRAVIFYYFFASRAMR